MPSRFCPCASRHATHCTHEHMGMFDAVCRAFMLHVLCCGVVVGGLWRNDNVWATSASGISNTPYTSLNAMGATTGGLACTSISSIAASASNVSYMSVGCGSWSSFEGYETDALGVFITKDGGNTWTKTNIKYGLKVQHTHWQQHRTALSPSQPKQSRKHSLETC